ncbi:MAG: phosphomethylpyrimidine kinase [Methanomicrobiales archaeon]|nr:phosphomethylpyrimidine kinase [Methanomicrobiales archaeon]
MAKSEHAVVLQQLEQAVASLGDYMDPFLIPEVGMNLVFAVAKAKEVQDVAGIAGRIVRLKGKVHPVGPVEFGASDHMARAVLTAMQFDPTIRSAANIRFSDTIVGILDELLFDICEFDRAREPPGIKTMDWGVATCCKEGVPDVIYDRGARGKEAMIRVFGEDPAIVTQKIIKVSVRIKDTHFD